jgi:hypothetical protein
MLPLIPLGILATGAYLLIKELTTKGKAHEENGNHRAGGDPAVSQHHDNSQHHGKPGLKKGGKAHAKQGKHHATGGSDGNNLSGEPSPAGSDHGKGGIGDESELENGTDNGGNDGDSGADQGSESVPE